MPWVTVVGTAVYAAGTVLRINQTRESCSFLFARNPHARFKLKFHRLTDEIPLQFKHLPELLGWISVYNVMFWASANAR